MNTQAVPEWLPSYFVPFLTLSYPIAPPAAPDSFPDSSYYGIGILDGCFIITCIAVMAVLRDFTRLYISEPFARWKLTRDLNNVKRANFAFANGAHLKVNGHANGGEKNGTANGHASGHVGVNGSAHGASALKSNGKANGAANGNGHAAHTCDLTVSGPESHKIHRSVIRFAEQTWSFIYYTTLWTWGLWIHTNLPTKVLDPIDAWLSLPNMPLAAPLKFYYLLETAFYMHQVLILNAEARRKDHWQMMTHHIITVGLMLGSYYCGFTRIGCLIMMLMDWCDIWFPLAKMLRYLAMTTLCDLTFVFFLLSWLVTRHALFILAIKSTLDNGFRIIGLLQHDHEHPKSMYYTFASSLVMLQLLQLMWFWMIMRVAWRVVSGQNAEDTRSDEDDKAEESKKER